MSLSNIIGLALQLIAMLVVWREATKLQSSAKMRVELNRAKRRNQLLGELYDAMHERCIMLERHNRSTLHLKAVLDTVALSTSDDVLDAAKAHLRRIAEAEANESKTQQV